MKILRQTLNHQYLINLSLAQCRDFLPSEKLYLTLSTYFFVLHSITYFTKTISYLNRYNKSNNKAKKKNLHPACFSLACLCL